MRVPMNITAPPLAQVWVTEAVGDIAAATGTVAGIMVDTLLYEATAADTALANLAPEQSRQSNFSGRPRMFPSSTLTEFLHRVSLATQSSAGSPRPHALAGPTSSQTASTATISHHAHWVLRRQL